MRDIFSLGGRISRGQFLLYLLSGSLYWYVFVMRVSTEGKSLIIQVIWFLGLCLFLNAMACALIRRLHDLDKREIHALFIFIPVYNIYFMIKLLIVKGTSGPNKYGNDPLTKEAIVSSDNNPSQASAGSNAEFSLEDSNSAPLKSIFKEAAPPPPPVSIADKTTNIDVNNAPEEKLAELPGVGPILAKKAISIREAQKGFASVDEFIETLDIKTHHIELIKDLTFAGPIAKSDTPIPTGRVVDY